MTLGSTENPNEGVGPFGSPGAVKGDINTVSLLELEKTGEECRSVTTLGDAESEDVVKRDRSVRSAASCKFPWKNPDPAFWKAYQSALPNALLSAPLLQRIVNDPAAAVLSVEMRDAVRTLASKSTVAVVSGRSRDKVREFVDLNDLYYAGSHGFDIAGPDGLRHSVSGEILPVLREARLTLEERLKKISGASLEDNCFSVSVHWRNVLDEASRAAVDDIVDELLKQPPYADALRKSNGRCVTELKPNVKWNKGEAVLYLLELLRRRDLVKREGATSESGESDGSAVSSLSMSSGAAGDDESRAWYDTVLPIYIGDDTTDEDAFDALRPLGGLAVLVNDAASSKERPRLTSASHTLKSVDEVRNFIRNLADQIDAQRDSDSDHSASDANDQINMTPATAAAEKTPLYVGSDDKKITAPPPPAALPSSSDNPSALPPAAPAAAHGSSDPPQTG